ncbi:MAG: ketopantoate reductase family protein, partial [Gemmobacter sp.]
VIGEGPGAEEVAARLRAAGIKAEVSGQTLAAQWEKLVINCALNAISAVTAAPYGRIVAQPGALDLMQGVVAECAAVAAASGVALPDGIWDQVLRIADAMPTQISSTAQDMQRGRATEIDFLNGEILRRGQALGLPTPLNAALTVLVKLAEQR